jgi:predicted DNA-binding transcriptional regulator YafY
MFNFTKEELEHILFALEDWRSPAADLSYYKNIQNKIKTIIEEMQDV